jgi:hypothetical protein
VVQGLPAHRGGRAASVPERPGSNPEARRLRELDVELLINRTCYASSTASGPKGDAVRDFSDHPAHDVERRNPTGSHEIHRRR